MAFRVGRVVACGVVVAIGATAAEAQLFASRENGFTDRTALIDRRLSSQYRHSDRLRPREEGAELAALRESIPRYRGQRSRFVEPARAAARRYGVPEDLFLRLVRQESGWNPTALSHKGAMGLAQLMPGTAARLGVDPTDPVQNLDGGARYLAAQFRRFGTWRLALAAYNAGPGAVDRYDGVPPFRETRNYIRAILERG